MHLLVSVSIVHRMWRGLDWGIEDATPQKDIIRPIEDITKPYWRHFMHAKSPTHQEVEVECKATKQKWSWQSWE